MFTFIKRVIAQVRPKPRPFTSDIIRSYSVSDGEMSYSTFKALERLGRALIEFDKKAKQASK